MNQVTSEAFFDCWRKHKRMANYLVSRILPTCRDRNIRRAELRQAAMLGLWQAMRDDDPTEPADFSTLAYAAMRYAILQEANGKGKYVVPIAGGG